MSGIEGTAQARRRERPKAGRPPGPPAAERLASGDEPDLYDAPPVISGERVDKPVNPYAPTGWQAKKRIEFDVQMPSGQMCLVMRLEREDLFRLNLMDYLDTFTPILMGDLADEERDAAVQDVIKENPDALVKMFAAIDQVVMAATIKPKITENKDLVNLGNESDWRDPNFVATVLLENIPMEERMYVFGAAFGQSMDALKSIWRETTGVGSLDDEPNVQQVAE